MTKSESGIVGINLELRRMEEGEHTEYAMMDVKRHQWSNKTPSSGCSASVFFQNNIVSSCRSSLTLVD